MSKRLDTLIYEQGLAPSREKAKALITAGLVSVNGACVTKPAASFEEDADIRISEENEVLRYVSRGGLKLEKALQCFTPDLTDCVCMDVGASTGGFTDCMLQNGARLVYSVDSGSGQLAQKLLSDPRVVNLEQTNIRYLTKEQIPEEVRFVSIDVSFISLTLVLPVVYEMTSSDASVAALIKPQFEAGKEKVGKKGVVRDPKIHREVLTSVIGFAKSVGFYAEGLTFSPVKGPEGNIEYLVYLKKNGNKSDHDRSRVNENVIASVVREAHNALDHKGAGR
ncbi:MAG: TlyA family RNA methyltransferase [Lachnospiraceae bacterium]|nr:TlyA family RNA methyltransferase [Lachnospiraceae bacterium]